MRVDVQVIDSHGWGTDFVPELIDAYKRADGPRRFFSTYGSRDRKIVCGMIERWAYERHGLTCTITARKVRGEDHVILAVDVLGGSSVLPPMYPLMPAA
jgi:hypothetical protein